MGTKERATVATLLMPFGASSAHREGRNRAAATLHVAGRTRCGAMAAALQPDYVRVIAESPPGTDRYGARMPTSKPVPARSVRPRRLLSVLVALLMMSALVGACGSTSTSSPGASGTTPAAEAGADPGQCPASNTKAFAKTRFVGHVALAFGAFHRYLYKPFKAGTFSSGHHGRFLGLIKAVAAGLVIKHEVRLAAEDVQANPTLCRDIAAPLRSFYAAISGLVTGIKGGDTTGIDGAQTSLASVISTAKGHAVSIVPDDNASIG
jgi:hypothetical protein